MVRQSLYRMQKGEARRHVYYEEAFLYIVFYKNLHKECGKPVDFTPFSCQSRVYFRCHHHIA